MWRVQKVVTEEGSQLIWGIEPAAQDLREIEALPLEMLPQYFAHQGEIVLKEPETTDDDVAEWQEFYEVYLENVKLNSRSSSSAAFGRNEDTEPYKVRCNVIYISAYFSSQKKAAFGGVARADHGDLIKAWTIFLGLFSESSRDHSSSYLSCTANGMEKKSG